MLNWRKIAISLSLTLQTLLTHILLLIEKLININSTRSFKCQEASKSTWAWRSHMPLLVKPLIHQSVLRTKVFPLKEIIITFRFTSQIFCCMYHVYDQHYIKRKTSNIRRITLFIRGRHNAINRMTLTFVLILGLIFYCTSGIRAMSIQNESDHAQLDELRQTVADLSTKIKVLNETIRKGKLDLITNWCTTILLSLCCRGRDRMVRLFWFTSTCAITADECFKFEFDFCPRGYLFDTTIDKKVCSWQFVFIGYSEKT